MNPRLYAELHRMAVRLVPTTADAEDLVQDTLLAAVIAGRAEPAWLSGVMRRQALFKARGEGRRRRRETEAVAASARVVDATDGGPTGEAADARRLLAPLLCALPRATRQVAVLALHGLDGREIGWLLRLTPAAFRQRLTSLRKAISCWPAVTCDAIDTAMACTGVSRYVALPVGPLRRALKAAMRGNDAVGSHDPDGHPILISRGPHTSVPVGNG